MAIAIADPTLGEGQVELHGFVKKNTEDTAEWPKVSTNAHEGGLIMTKKNKHAGSSLEDFLEEEGICQDAKEAALARAVSDMHINKKGGCKM